MGTGIASHFKLSLIVLSLSAIFSNIIFPQECDNCSHPRVALYDFKMLVDRPTEDSLIIKWLELFWPGVSTKTYLRNNDPYKDCITWQDGAVINANSIQGGTLRFGNEYVNVPPDGPVTTTDYILSGYTTELGDDCESAVSLETGETREVVKFASVIYKNVPDKVTQASITLAAQFGSVWQAIKDFEKYKRDTDNGVAIRDITSKLPDIKLTPQKQKIDIEESCDVEVELIDCDGVALANRKVYFVDTTINGYFFQGTTGGKVEPPIAITDASGKARVKFTAGRTTGIQQITASFPHRKPTGKFDAFIGSTAINVGLPPSDYWYLQASISEEYIRELDSSISGTNQSGRYSFCEKMQGTAFITALVENGSGSDSTFYAVYYDEYGYPMENCTISGNGSEDYYSNFYLQWGVPLPDVRISKHSFRGVFEPGNTGFEFHYPTEPGDIVIAVQVGGTGSGPTEWTYTDYWEDKIIKENDNGSSSIGASAAYNHGECTVTKTDSAYIITGSQTKKYESSYPGGGTEYTTDITTLNVSLSKDGSTTGIFNDGKTIPGAFRLDQNYPNPFNPVTIISYQLPGPGKVTLRVYNILGCEIATLVNREQGAGSYRIPFNAAGLASGIYYYALEYGTKTSVRKMILMK